MRRLHPEVDRPRLRPDDPAEKRRPAYALRHLKRFPPGTPYTRIGARLAELFSHPPLAHSKLVVDQTGVGRPVVCLLRRSGIKATVRPVTVTSGHQAWPDDRGGWLVPKKELVSNLQVLLQARRLKVAPDLAEAMTLARELQKFRAKVTTSAAEAPEDWRERSHDDLVLAVAVAAWDGERSRPAETSFAPYVLGGPPGGLTARRPGLSARPGRLLR